MSSFDLGPDVILRCTDCGHVQLERHFREGRSCTLCRGDGEEIRKIDNSGPSFRDKQLYRNVEEASGVGEATARNIRDTFSVEAFIDACRTAYEKADFTVCEANRFSEDCPAGQSNTSTLEAVSGVGSSTAEAIADHVGEKKDWEKQRYQLVA